MQGNRGFTLTEVMMVIGAFLVMSTILVGALAIGLDFWGVAVCRSEVQASGQLAMNAMVKELRNATRSKAGVPPNVLIMPAPNNTSLRLYLPMDIDMDVTIINAVSGVTEWNINNPINYQFDQPAGQLVRVEGGVTRVLANNVIAASFDDASTDIALFKDEIRITMQLRRMTARGRIVARSFLCVVKLRN